MDNNHLYLLSSEPTWINQDLDDITPEILLRANSKHPSQVVSVIRSTDEEISLNDKCNKFGSLKETRHKCEHCGKCFNHNSSLRRHEKAHTRGKFFECQVCGKKFTQKGGLKLHTRIHSGLKPYKCEDCGKEFTRSDHYQLHQRVHTGETRFECDYCGKRFTDKSHFNKHQTVHTKKKYYTCSICRKVFKRYDFYDRHQKSHSDILKVKFKVKQKKLKT